MLINSRTRPNLESERLANYCIIAETKAYISLILTKIRPAHIDFLHHTYFSTFSSLSRSIVTPSLRHTSGTYWLYVCVCLLLYLSSHTSLTHFSLPHPLLTPQLLSHSFSSCSLLTHSSTLSLSFFPHSLPHSTLIVSDSPHSFLHFSLTYSLTPASFTHSLTPASLTHSLTPKDTSPLTHSLILPLVTPLLLFPSLPHSLTQPSLSTNHTYHRANVNSEDRERARELDVVRGGVFGGQVVVGGVVFVGRSGRYGKEGSLWEGG